MLMFLEFACASYEVSFEDKADFEIYDSGIADEPSLAAEDGESEYLEYHWQPVIDLKIDSNGDVIFEGSKAEILFFENGTVVCVEDVDNLALVQVESPIEQASSWWELSFSRVELDSNQSTGCMPLQMQSFAVGMGELHSETLASWGGVNWQGLEPLGISQLEHSSYISFHDKPEIWVYGVAVVREGWVYLRPSYKFPL